MTKLIVRSLKLLLASKPDPLRWAPVWVRRYAAFFLIARKYRLTAPSTSEQAMYRLFRLFQLKKSLRTICRPQRRWSECNYRTSDSQVQVTKPKPSGAGSVWKGGARERADDVLFCRRQKRTSEQSGLCSDVGPSGETRTPGIQLPKLARYQLRYTRI